jgi:hypothetical protein
MVPPKKTAFMAGDGDPKDPCNGFIAQEKVLNRWC